MDRRKQDTRALKRSICIIGEGITELYYFSHIRQLLGFRCTIKPRWFDNTSVAKIEKNIRELLRSDVSVICVFDADVPSRNESERKKLELLQSKHKDSTNLLLCKSLPSIEFWFLLHYLDTNRHFNTAKDAERELKRHIQGYDKTTKFLEQSSWVNNLCSNNRLTLAMQRAKKHAEDAGSYSNVYKAFEFLKAES
jgi:hypothetical protein